MTRFNMQRNTPYMYLVVLAVAFLVALAAYSPTVRSQTSTSTFIIGYGGTPFDTFNPFTTYTVVSTMSTIDVYDYLVRYNSTFSPVVPDLAYKWEVFPNNSAAEFWLVRNATWRVVCQSPRRMRYTVLRWRITPR